MIITLAQSIEAMQYGAEYDVEEEENTNQNNQNNKINEINNSPVNKSANNSPAHRESTSPRKSKKYQSNSSAYKYY